MRQLSESERHALQDCGCDVEQIDALCECGCTDVAILRLRRRRAELMEDLHERQGRIDRLDAVVRSLRR